MHYLERGKSSKFALKIDRRDQYPSPDLSDPGLALDGEALSYWVSAGSVPEVVAPLDDFLS